MTRLFSILAVLVWCAVPARARTACAAPSAPEELKLPAFTATQKTPACVLRINAARAQVQKEDDAFLAAQRRIYQDMIRILDLQNGVACEPSARAYETLRRRQYAAVLKELTEELSDGLGPCGAVVPPPAPAPEPDESAPKQDQPPMLEPI